MAASSSMKNLAARIHLNTTKLDDFLTEKGLEPFSFSAHRSSTLDLPSEYEDIRQQIVDDTAELHELTSGPREQIYSFAHGSKILTALHAIYHFKLAELIPIGKEMSFQEISQACNVNEPDVRRLLRLVISYHIFDESRIGFVGHSATSKLLAQDAQMRDWLGTLCEDIWPAATRAVPAMVKWPNSTEAQQSGYCLAHNTDLPIYLDLQKYPERARRFAGSMAEYTTGPSFSYSHILRAFDWASLGKATVVDIGGSHGEVVTAIGNEFPDLHLVVQDLPSVIESRPSATNTEGRPAGIEFMSHDMFTEQPVKQADVYFFRWIFHGWDDARCISLLQNLIPALKNGARVLINDFCLPEPRLLPKMKERTVRVMDVAQLVLQNSRERYTYEYEELFKKADERFQFVGFAQPLGSALAIIEAKWVDKDL